MTDTISNVDNSSDLANSLFTDLTVGINVPASPNLDDSKFNFNVDNTSALYDDIIGATLEEVTENKLDGVGVFDVFMSSMDKHLEREFKGGRITGTQYAEVYTQVSQQVMAQSVSFVLQKDQARWGAVTTQMQARIAEIKATQALIELEKAKVDTAKANFDMQNAAAEFALTKMKVASEEARHDDITASAATKNFNLKYLMPAELAIKQFERTQIMPSTVAMNNVQVDRILPAQAAIAEFNNRVLQPLEKDIQELQRDRVIPANAGIDEFRLNSQLPVELALQQHVLNVQQPAQTELIQEQIEVQRANTLDTRRDGLTPISGVVAIQKRNLTSDADIKDFTLASQLPKQVDLVDRQILLTEEQVESERAKTLDTRTGGESVTGSVGKQKQLYDEQIASFVKDAAHKTAKMYLDAWITQKTLDEGLNAPTELTNNEINSVLAQVRSNNAL